MDYSKLTTAQRGACVEMLGVLLGSALRNRDHNEFTGQARMAYLAAWQELVNVLTAELSALRQSGE